jgi:hypothetical protein
MDKQGLRERIVQTAPAPGTPFDHGQFELVVEKRDGTPLSSEQRNGTAIAPTNGSGKLVQITSARPRVSAKPAATIQEYHERELLQLCRGCNRHVLPGEVTCPHCDGDLKTFERDYQKRMRAVRRAYRELVKHLPPM